MESTAKMGKVDKLLKTATIDEILEITKKTQQVGRKLKAEKNKETRKAKQLAYLASRKDKGDEKYTFWLSKDESKAFDETLTKKNEKVSSYIQNIIKLADLADFSNMIDQFLPTSGKARGIMIAEMERGLKLKYDKSVSSTTTLQPNPSAVPTQNIAAGNESIDFRKELSSASN